MNTGYIFAKTPHQFSNNIKHQHFLIFNVKKPLLVYFSFRLFNFCTKHVDLISIIPLRANSQK